eukprot:1457183-Rhodomonas_salina.1
MAFTSGGGVWTGSDVTLSTMCNFTSNTANMGGGMTADGTNAAVTVTDTAGCTFMTNEAKVGAGGGVYADTSTYDGAGTNFTMNTAATTGGA